MPVRALAAALACDDHVARPEKNHSAPGICCTGGEWLSRHFGESKQKDS